MIAADCRIKGMWYSDCRTFGTQPGWIFLLPQQHLIRICRITASMCFQLVRQRADDLFLVLYTYIRFNQLRYELKSHLLSLPSIPLPENIETAPAACCFSAGFAVLSHPLLHSPASSGFADVILNLQKPESSTSGSVCFHRQNIPVFLMTKWKSDFSARPPQVLRVEV